MSQSIWTYSDGEDRGFGLFKRLVFQQLQAHGWQTWMASAPLLEPASKPLLCQHLLEKKPDWILLINQSASQLYEYLEIPDDLRPHDAKKWIWYLDDPHFYIDRLFESNEYVFSFDDTYLDFIKQHNPHACGCLPLACDINSTGTFDSRFSCDLSFVGGVIDQSKRRAQLPPQMQSYIDRLVELQLENRDKTFFQIAEENPIEPGKQININALVAHYLYWEANNLRRVKVLEELQEFDLRIYGNQDWEIMLKDSPLINCFYGPVDPINELPKVFASSKINLNIHSVQCRGSLNQRDFNAPVAGGFLLSDWVPAAGRFFDPGRESIFWSSVDDLKNKIAYYLKYPKERRRIIKQGRDRVLRDHTYPQRIENALQVINQSISA